MTRTLMKTQPLRAEVFYKKKSVLKNFEKCSIVSFYSSLIKACLQNILTPSGCLKKSYLADNALIEFLNYSFLNYAAQKKEAIATKFSTENFFF